MIHQRRLLSIGMATIMFVSLCAVCASTSVSAATSSSANATTSKPVSTSVSAAPSSGANVQPSTGLVGAPAGIVGSPAVVSQAPHYCALFVRGTDNALWWRYETAGIWKEWKSLGGYLTSSPDAAYYNYGKGLFVCARGSNGALWYRFASDSIGWSQWMNSGGQLLAGTGPAVVLWSTAKAVRIAVTGTNHAIYWWNNKNWVNLGGYLTSSPDAVSDAALYGSPEASKVHIVARGGDGALWSRYTSDGGASWSTWGKVGGKLLAGTGPAVVWNDGLNIAYFVTGTNHALYWWTGSSWANLGGYLTASPAAISYTNGAVDVFVRGGDGALWSRYTSDGGANWNPWYKIPW